MPAYNHAPYVRAAVESVLGQTYGNLELIVIDDASTDETWSVLQSFEDVRIRLLRQEVNQGAHATLNEALALARGDFIAIINSDDVYHPGRIETLISEAIRGGEDALIFTDVEFIDAQGAPADEHPRALGYRTLRTRCATLPPSLWLLTGNPVISTSNFFCSRTLAQATGPFAPLRFTHDWDWALRASSRAAPTWVGKALLSYRVHAANTLSEDDTWRHVHENSYIQAKALLTLGRTTGRRPRDVAAARMACLALLQNESFHPLALSLYLACLQGGIEDGDLLALSCARGGDWILKELADAASCPASLFGPLRTLAESENVIAAQSALIYERDKTIAAQAAMADERWRAMQEMNGMIAERDKTIAAQAAMADERWRAMQEMNGMIAEQDKTIAAQARMIEERWNAIQQMGAEIASRDSKISELEKDLRDPLV
jgi:GT2 family glycosyltransferase/uncharacterized coiled-coil protein SlyX